MQDKHQVKQVRIFDEVEMIKKKLIMDGNSKSSMCNVDGQSFIPLFQEIGLETLEPPASSQMIHLVFMRQQQRGRRMLLSKKWMIEQFATHWNESSTASKPT